MRFAAFYKPNGVVTQVSSYQDGEEPVGELPWVELPAFVTADSGKVVSGQWAAYSPQGAEQKARPPGYASEWDPVSETWVDLRTQAQKTNAQWDLVRAERNRLLLDSDWTQMPDVTISNKAAWATYRQQLRDVTDQPDPFNITWPVRP